MVDEEKQRVIQFGLIWSFIFLFVGFYFLDDTAMGVFLLILAIILACITVTRPELLEPVCSMWIQFGEKIGHIVSMILMTVIYLTLFIPVGLTLRVFRVDLLNKTIDRARQSYWDNRESQPQDMFKQF